MEVKAALASIPFCVVEIQEAACRGAAILAGLGIGLYKSPEDIQCSVEYREKPIRGSCWLGRWLIVSVSTKFSGSYILPCVICSNKS
jgi:hypothetical protein